MTEIADVLDGIDTVLKTIEGLNVRDHIPGSTPDFPVAFLHPVPVTDYRDGGEADQVHVFEIIVLVSQTLYENQRTVLPYLERTGSKSIFALFENNRTLGLNGVDAHVRETRPLDQQEVAGYFGSGAAVTLVISLSAG